MTELLPCPFCKAGETIIDEQTYWAGMRSQIISASVRHWCPKNPLQSYIEIKAKTKEEAVALWNTRATPQPIEVEKLKREVYAQEFVRHCECDSDLISCAIDHLAAHYNITKKGE